jgi:hypothetical protein
LLGTTTSCFRNTKGLENKGQWAKLGESVLEEIGSHKGGEKEKILVHKERVGAAVHAQRYAQQNKKSGDGVNPVSNNHGMVLYLFD